MTVVPQALVATCTAWLLASSLWIYPHSLSYFNESIGGPLNGPKHLLGSNVDWGQDLKYLRNWQLNNASHVPVYVSHDGVKETAQEGLSAGTVPDNTNVRISQQPAAYCAISTNLLYGLAASAPTSAGGMIAYDSEYFAEFRNVPPIAHAGYSISIFGVVVSAANVDCDMH